MTQPIPPVPDLDAIRADLAEIKDRFGDRHYRGETAWFSSAWANVGRHVPALLTEVERLRERVTAAEEYAEDAAILKSGQPWEELFRQRDEAIAERDRLQAVVALNPSWAAYLAIVEDAELRRHAEDLAREVREARAENETLREELSRWTSGQRRKGLPVVESVPDGLRYAAELVRAQGTEGGEELDRLLAEAGQRLKQLNDTASRLLAERDRYAEVVQAARQWREMRRGEPMPTTTAAALIAAVDRLTPGDTASLQSARDLATAYSQLITEHDRLMSRRAELILSGVDPDELLMPEVPLPPPGDGDG